MQDHRRDLGKGFNWLGGATVAAKIIDFCTILTMLLFLSKRQVGIASLVLSIGMVVEACNGLGTSEALIQSKTISRRQVDALFWYVTGAAVLVGTLTLLAAPVIAAIYGMPGMATYFLAIAIKQPLVGIALIPLAMMNRNLQFERIAIVNVCATFAAAATRLALGAGGAGVWALVAGYSASGFYIMVGALLARPYRPRLRLHLSAVLPLARYGWRAATSNISEQMFKNVDYMLIGWFYGPSLLAVYRVAFDVAMEPAMAVGTLVNRTALPVFARASAQAADLTSILRWSLGKIAVLVAPLMAALVLAAGPLTAMLHDDRNSSYIAAATPLRFLAAAALLRVMTMLFSTMMLGVGRPGMAARLALATLLLLASAILLVGLTFQAETGIIAAAAIWLGLYPPVLLWATWILWRRWRIRPGALARAFAAPCIGIAALVLLVAGGDLLVGADPKARLALVAAATALIYAALFLWERRRAPLPSQ
ncbi:oligosaccharide flippase family protein [Lichenicoccus sp.]|uniref:oligosaccharide flippase family protein n=1 Tax=Lichenicoccus sp. TaxID=2781899 RepID=UPI003D14E3B7